MATNKKKSVPKKSGSKKKSKSKISGFKITVVIIFLVMITAGAYHYYTKSAKYQNEVKKIGQSVKNIISSDKENDKKVEKKIKQEEGKEQQKEVQIKDEKPLKEKSVQESEKPKSINEKSDKKISDETLAKFAKQISPVAKKMLNTPYKHGADPQKDGATDNSHLIFYLWSKAAKETGLSIGQYRPMDDLVKGCIEIPLSALNNGDLIVLKDGNAGVIYGFNEGGDGFYLIYTSKQAGKVIFVDSRELRKYWLNPQNKVGYYRVTKKLFK